MHASQLHKLARQLREIALATTGNTGDECISAGALAIIEDVASHPATSVGEIAGRTGLAQSLVSRTVATMREAGVFATAPDAADRRRSLVSIDPTTRIQLFRDRGARSIEPELVRAFPGSDPATIARALALLEELAALFEHYHADDTAKDPTARR